MSEDVAETGVTESEVIGSEVIGREPDSAGSSVTNTERLVFFTDAIAAIALTLLVLPLLDVVTEGAGDNEPLAELLRHNVGKFGGFALSFVVIFRFWWGHHRVFKHLETVNTRLVQFSLLWTFAIVCMPITTAVITAYPPSRLSVLFYGVNLIVASGAISMISVYAYRHPEHSEGRARVGRHEVVGILTILGIQFVATGLGCLVVHPVNYWAFLLMFLTGPIETVVMSRWSRTR